MEQESDFLLHTHNDLLKSVALLWNLCLFLSSYFRVLSLLPQQAVLWCAGVLMDFGVQGCGLAQNSSMLQSLQRDKDEASQSVARVRARVSVVSAAARHDIDAEQRCE